MTSDSNTSLSKVSKTSNYFPISEIQRRIDDFFSDMSYLPNSSLAGWLPSLNASESDNSILIKVELPSMNEKDITINIRKNRIFISGEKKSDIEDDGNTYHISEISYGKFSRTVALPFDLDANKTKASFSNGLLTIKVEKPQQTKETTKTIPITREHY